MLIYSLIKMISSNTADKIKSTALVLADDSEVKRKLIAGMIGRLDPHSKIEIWSIFLFALLPEQTLLLLIDEICKEYASNVNCENDADIPIYNFD